MQHFILRHGHVYCFATHTLQRDPNKTVGEAIDFINVHCTLSDEPLWYKRYGWIFHHDLHNFEFCLPHKLLCISGSSTWIKHLSIFWCIQTKQSNFVKKTINVWGSTDDTKRCTVAVTITASGHKLPLLVVCKGKTTGKIAKKELHKYEKGPVYVSQDNAWMDRDVMLLWVNQVLKPYAQMAPLHVRPIFYLDSYCCHMLRDVVS